MLFTARILTGLLLVLGVEAAMADTNPKPEDLVQILLNDDRLVEYFHFDVRPDPLPLADRSGADIDLAGLSAQGHATQAAREDGEDALVIERFEQEGGKARIAFRYRPEGISGAAHFAADASGWTIESLDLTEN